MTSRARLQNTVPKGIHAGRITPQNNQTLTGMPVVVAGLSDEFSLTELLQTRRMPKDGTSNANVYAYAQLKNYASFNWRITNTNAESEPLYCYLYGSTSPHASVENVGDLEMIRRVAPNETINFNVPVRSHHYRTEYRIANAANVDVSADVRTVPYQTFANDQPIYTTYGQHHNASLTRPTARFDSELVRDRCFGSQLVNIQSRVTSLSTGVQQPTWDIDATYTRLDAAYQMNVKSTDAADDDLVLLIEGLDADGAYQSESLLLADALGGEDTTASFLKVNRVTVTGGTASQYYNAGDISVAYDAGGGGGYFLQEYVRAGASVSTTAKYAVPTGKSVVLRSLRMVGTLDADSTVAVFRWGSLDDVTIRYELLEFDGLSHGGGETTYQLNEHLTEGEEMAVVLVNAVGVVTNVFTAGLVFEEYDNAESVANPV
jgi:hypothetical protein